MKRCLGLGLAAAIVAVTLGGCGSPRSVEAYCDVIAKHKERYVTAMAEANSAIGTESLEGMLGGLVGAIAAMGDLNVMWSEAAKVAPDEIATDVEAVAESWKKQADTAKQMMDDPLGALMGGLMDGLMSSGSMQRVNDYTATNCPGVGGMFYN